MSTIDQLKAENIYFRSIITQSCRRSYTPVPLISDSYQHTMNVLLVSILVTLVATQAGCIGKRDTGGCVDFQGNRRYV